MSQNILNLSRSLARLNLRGPSYTLIQCTRALNCSSLQYALQLKSSERARSGKCPTHSTVASSQNMISSPPGSGLVVQKSELHTTGTAPHDNKFKDGFVKFKEHPIYKKGTYTLKPIPFPKSGGRDPKTGRIAIHGIGGGHKRRYRMVDFKRIGPEKGPPTTEKVVSIKYDPNRSARIAIVAGGTHKRYILATRNMQAGNLIRTYGEIPRMPVLAEEGDAHPVGALPIGTLVHNVEVQPHLGGALVRAAGTTAQVLRKAAGQVILQLPSKHQISIDERCMVTVGQVSNHEHNQRIIGKAGRNRWLGKRPSSGLWQRKGGWAGRKIRPLPPIKVYLASDKVEEKET
ncbi:large ribosomal subunit protein uL2m-like [Branchiostoma floridae x Branchiostoma japonicum]